MAFCIINALFFRDDYIAYKDDTAKDPNAIAAIAFGRKRFRNWQDSWLRPVAERNRKKAWLPDLTYSLP
jgi:hypothetical protein